VFSGQTAIDRIKHRKLGLLDRGDGSRCSTSSESIDTTLAANRDGGNTQHRADRFLQIYAARLDILPQSANIDATA